ncbi:DUF4145 domain-containing protein [Epilithonimonas vandammei]|uniref:DUF4145 domain-containing protein n=1 Tax=Epilithonimonas vandammei TaxID=2487072 RepID=UPI0028AC2036|nr:DUF4145 domain-containing protein [Epilithonimonas vandammei]
MKNINAIDFLQYLKNNHNLLYNDYKDYEYSGEFDGTCDYCKKDVFFKIISKRYVNGIFDDSYEFPIFHTLQLKCPKCLRIIIKQTVKIKLEEIYNSKDELMESTINFDDEEYENEEFSRKYEYLIFEILSIPTSEIEESLENIPQKYISLRDSVSEAIFAMNHNKNISATIMFRRAIQIIAKEILGAQGKSLYGQLEWLKINENKLKIDLSEIFHEHTKLIKDIGNQGAHPEEDIELQNFSSNDVNSLHDLFLIIIFEIFVKPEKLKQIKEELRNSRKIQ